VRAVLGAVACVSQDACGNGAALAFLRPPRSARTRTESALLSYGHLVRVAGRHGDVAAWQWGRGPRVLLVHGWGGHAARLRHFVAPLLQAGFGVVAFDAPGHGLSRGSFASLPDFIEAVELVARVTNPVALVGHSMGAAACALALRGGLEARAAVLLSPPEDPEKYAIRFARYLRLSAAATSRMTERLQERYGVRLCDLRLSGKGPAVPTLVFHDARDARVPLRDGEAIAASWPCVRLVVTRGLGHHRILRDRAVVEHAVSFLQSAVGPAGAGARTSLPAAVWLAPARFLKKKGAAVQFRAALGG
jgi:pimeloyl-ACP methyl ester carboxylesterase